MTWVLIAWSMAFAVWILIVLTRGGSQCAHERFHSVCETNSNLGKGIGVLVLACLWLLGFLILSVAWLLSKPKG